MTIIRWQDWMDVALGCWLAVSPWALGFTLNQAAMANTCGLGVALIVFNLISACRLSDTGQEIFNIALGLWLIVSPFAFGFATEKVPAENSVVAGITIVVLACWQIYDAAKGRKGR
jgi:SPW repeat